MCQPMPQPNATTTSSLLTQNSKTSKIERYPEVLIFFFLSSYMSDTRIRMTSVSQENHWRLEGSGQYFENSEGK